VFRVLVGALLLVVALVWIVLGTVSYARWYRWVTGSFVLSGVLSLAGSWMLGRSMGPAGALGGYVLGFVVLLGCLYGLWRWRFGAGPAWDKHVFEAFRQWGPIAGVGLFYQLGVWADKIVLWTLRGHPIGRTPLRALPEYDILTFLAYLSIVPALSYFLIVVETEFFARYRTYLSSVRRGTLLTVWDSEGHLRQALRRGLWRMAEYQAVTTLCLALAAEPILTWLNLSAWSAELFRVLLVAAGFQVLLLTVVLFLLYFELRWEACWVSVLFCVGNFVCTAAVAHGALPWLGMGYAVATGLAFLVGVVWLELKMRRVTFLLFARQPVVD